MMVEEVWRANSLNLWRKTCGVLAKNMESGSSQNFQLIPYRKYYEGDSTVIKAGEIVSIEHKDSQMSLLAENCFPTYPDITQTTSNTDDDHRIVVSSIAQMKDNEIDVRSLFLIEH